MTTDAKIRNAKPGARPYKIPCEKGLFALINPNGSKLWRFKYRHNGKEKLGTYILNSHSRFIVPKNFGPPKADRGLKPPSSDEFSSVGGLVRRAVLAAITYRIHLVVVEYKDLVHAMELSI
uniref:Integrase DNA-binding domain-containing protein n=1 Tax=Candidatus Kentrum eta TaxID=2126337 RepID=A0A450VJL7_9GAMM|nr:MAG: Domain of unknown function (DUF4102) [Candidatus Kentron sp. H]VFK03426.1 MAG: Domain of unknown function (DUF4102) [Candidatus Kentron sp. H]VFK05014.1 MAG: Domain of unknown function (DUF4102) [Candidatus Kentron sp. H]